jgi:hypothetical protein
MCELSLAGVGLVTAFGGTLSFTGFFIYKQIKHKLNKSKMEMLR